MLPHLLYYWVAQENEKLVGSYLGVWMARFDDGQNQYINLFFELQIMNILGYGFQLESRSTLRRDRWKDFRKKQTDIYGYFSIMVNVSAIAPGKNS